MEHFETEKFDLSRNQEKFLISLLSSNTVEAAAKDSGISRATAYRWLNDDVFLKAYANARQEAFGRSMDNLQRLSGKAVKALEQILDNKRAAKNAKIAACRLILEHGRGWAEFRLTFEKIAEHERILNELEKQNR